MELKKISQTYTEIQKNHKGFVVQISVKSKINTNFPKRLFQYFDALPCTSPNSIKSLRLRQN